MTHSQEPIGGSRTGLVQVIEQQTVGESGYAFVIGGTGGQRGRYIISQHGKRDGESIWATRDADGNFVIQDIAEQTNLLALNATVASSHDCAFGKWLHRDGKSQFGGRQVFRSIEEKHAQVHDFARDIVTLYNDDRKRGGRQSGNIP